MFVVNPGYQASESQLPSFKGKKDTAWSPVPDKPREQMKPLWDYARYKSGLGVLWLQVGPERPQSCNYI